jgi:hypothetical protein
LQPFNFAQKSKVFEKKCEGFALQHKNLRNIAIVIVERRKV